MIRWTLSKSSRALRVSCAAMAAWGFAACGETAVDDCDQGCAGESARSGGGSGGRPSTNTGGAGGEEETSSGGKPHPAVGGAAGASTGGKGEAGAGTGGSPESCEAVLDRFRVVGCGYEHMCQVAQDDCEARVFCNGTEVVTVDLREGAAEFPHPENRTCSIELSPERASITCPAEGQLKVCKASTPGFIPHPACVELPESATNLRSCDEAWNRLAPETNQEHASACKIVQQNCAVQLLCDDELVLTGEASLEGLSLGNAAVSCESDWAGDRLAGTCAWDEGGASSECAWSLDIGEKEPSSCEPIAPEEGFVLAGCVRDGNICHMFQNDCLWNVTCGEERYTGRFDEDRTLEFTSNLGADCAGQIEDGKLSGHCEWGVEWCDFTTGVVQVDESCVQLPSVVEIVRGESSASCLLTQNECHFQASCASGRDVYYGTVTDRELIFKSNDGTCSASLDEGGARFDGHCENRTGAEEPFALF